MDSRISILQTISHDEISGIVRFIESDTYNPAAACGERMPIYVRGASSYYEARVWNLF